MVSAVSETEFIHSPNHPDSSAVTFRLALRQKTKVRDFGRHEQHRGGIWASRHAGAASDTGGRFHREIRIMLWYWQRIRFRGGSCSDHNVASSFDDLIEGTAVNHEILDRWKSRSAEWLDPDCVSVGKSSHVNLACGSLPGPCETPLMTSEHVPQMPSRQSESKAIGSSSTDTSVSFSMSSISRNEASDGMSFAS
jgi:hypothetical protein